VGEGAFCRRLIPPRKLLTLLPFVSKLTAKIRKRAKILSAHHPKAGLGGGAKSSVLSAIRMFSKPLRLAIITIVKSNVGGSATKFMNFERG